MARSSTAMTLESWNRVADDYDDEVFDVLAHDRQGLIASRIARFGAARRRAIDFGCGNGRFLPLLARHFGRVHALDHSPRLLVRAKHRWAALGNIEFTRADLCADGTRWPAADFGLSVNVLMAPSPSKRRAMLECIRRSLRRGAHLLLVVPSLESALLSSRRRIQWNERLGHSPGRAVTAGLTRDERLSARDLEQGVMLAGGVRTKHCLREEIEIVLDTHGFAPLEILKIEYPWSTEFENPPRWMRAPHPWDWLALARRAR